MPQVIPLIAAAFVGVANVVSGVAMAVALPTLGATAALNIGSAVFIGVAALGGASGFVAMAQAWATVAAVASLAVKPKIPQSSAGQISLKLDPQGPIPVALGRTATGGYIIYRAGFGPKNKHLAIITALSTGPIQAIEDFYANDVLCTFTSTSAGPTTTSGQWTNKMRQFRLLGETADTAYDLAVPPFEAELPGWTVDHKTTGFATSLWVNQYDTGRYPTGLPRGLWVVQGEKFYDPRLDSTYPGGSGAHRLATPSTWAYTENPYIMALGWILGRYHNGKKVWGCGVPTTGIDWVSYVDGANVADANVWKAGGVITSADDKRAVLDAILQAGSGIALPRGGLISCMVNSPKTSIYTITTTDVVGEVSIQTSQPRRNRVNTITPKYRSEANRWQVVMGGAVGNATYVSEDGGETRTKEIEYSLCQSVTQVAQLAAYDLVNAREGLLFTVVCKPRLLNVKIGEAVSINLDELGVSAQKGIVLARSFDPASLNVTLTIRSETEAKHAYALGKTTTAPPSPTLTRYDPSTIAAPAAGSWTATGGTVTNGTTTLPAVFVSGTTDDTNAASVIIEYRKTGTATYAMWAEGPAASGAFEITGLAASTGYEVAVSYRSIRGVVGSRLALASTTTGGVISDNGIVTVTSLPATGTVGQTVYLTTTGSLWSWNGTVWVELVSTGVAAGSIDITKFAASVRPVQLVASLPGSGTNGDIVFLTTTGKLYRRVAGAWVSLVDAAEISGIFTDAQIAGLAAAKLTGLITNTQIGTNAIDTPQLNAGAVTAAKIFADAVTAGKIDVDAVTAREILALTITSAEMAVDSIIAGKVAAGAINTRELVAGAVTTPKLAVSARPITTPNLIFTASAGTLSWSAGFIGWVDDAGTAAGVAISAGSTTTTNAYIYWVGNAASSTLSVTTSLATAMGAGNILIGWYNGSDTWYPERGQTLISGSFIQTNAINATHINVANLSAIQANLGTVTAGVLRNSASTYAINATLGVSVGFVGSYMHVHGAGFGATSNLIEWFGATPASATVTDPKLSTLTIANSQWARASDGITYSGGAALGALATITLPSYAGNAAALAAGLGAGRFYFDTTDNQVKAVIAPEFYLTASPASVMDTFYGSGNYSTPTLTVTPVGNRGSVTYSWTNLSAGGMTAASPTNAATQFSKTGMNSGDYLSSNFRCIATDAAGARAEIIILAQLLVI